MTETLNLEWLQRNDQPHSHADFPSRRRKELVGTRAAVK